MQTHIVQREKDNYVVHKNAFRIYWFSILLQAD